MKKSELNEIERAINTSDDEDASKILKHKMLVSSSILLAISFVIFILAIVLGKTSSMLSIISPSVYYVISSLFVLFLGVTVVIFSLLKNNIKPRLTLIYYKIYDIISFAFMLITSLMFLFIFIITPTTVVGSSMDKTLANGEKVLIWHLGYEPSRDDVVVAHVSGKYNGTSEMLIIKRVIAVAGDKVELRDGHSLYVNDEYITSSRINQEVFNIINGFDLNSKLTSNIIEDGKCLLLGDNRPVSNDSRAMGLINTSDVIGRAVFKVFPFKSIGGIGDKKIDL